MISSDSLKGDLFVYFARSKIKIRETRSNRTYRNTIYNSPHRLKNDFDNWSATASVRTMSIRALLLLGNFATEFFGVTGGTTLKVWRRRRDVPCSRAVADGGNRVERSRSRNLIVRSAGKRSGLPWRWDYGLAHLTPGSRGALFIGNNILRLSHFRAAEHFYSVVSRFISFLYIACIRGEPLPPRARAADAAPPTRACTSPQPSQVC